MQQLILVTYTAIWWLTEPHYGHNWFYNAGPGQTLCDTLTQSQELQPDKEVPIGRTNYLKKCSMFYARQAHSW